MLIFPAIDIKDKTCVRLFKGDFSTVEKVADSYMETACSFQKAGSVWIHMVDLDGAKDAMPKNSEVFIDVAKNTDLSVQVGGGIRDIKTVEFYLNSGIERVILGSAAVNNPSFVKEATKEFSSHIAVGIDAKNEMVATEGWIDSSNIHYLELAKRMEDIGVSTIIYTDISKDGTLEGANVEHYKMLSNAVGCDIIASGGIKDIEDIKKLRELNLYGAICGKSLYKGSLSLTEAIAVGK